jgi:DNA-binding beta-propeller fold protein YncE
VLVAVGAALAAAVAVGLALAFRGGSSVTVLPNSLVEIDPATNEVVDSIGVGAQPGQVRVLGGNVFVTSVKNKTLSRIEARTGAVRTSGEHAAGPGIAAAGDHLWVGSETRSEVTRVSPNSLAALERIRLVGRAPGDLVHALVALGAGSVWVSEVAPSTIERWSLRTHRLIRRYELGALEFPVEITFGERAAWVPLFFAAELLRINPVVGFGSVWVSSTRQGTVWRIDPDLERVERVIAVGGVPFGTTVGAGSVWVADYCRGTVVRIDPATNEIVARIETGHIPRWLAFGADRVWVSVAGEDTFDFLSTPQCKGS